MSFHVASAVYKAKFGSLTRKAVALKLADCSNDDGGSIFMSVGRIARELEMSDRTVQRTLKQFVDEGLLVIDKPGGNGPRSTTHYRFALDRLSGLPRTSGAKGDSTAPFPQTSRVTAATAKGDADDAKGDTVSPDPSLPESHPLDSARGAQARPAHINADETYVPGKKMPLAQARAKGWTPSAQEQAWSLAVKMLGSQEIAEMEAVQFTNYWEGEGKSKADWNKAFLKWVGDELKKRQEREEAQQQRAASVRGRSTRQSPIQNLEL